MHERNRLAFALCVGLAMVYPAHAERADRDKPVNVESDRMNADDAKKVAVFEGRVVLTQGTLIIRGDKLTVRQDDKGFQYGIVEGKLATFRQKREGYDEYIDGEAERIEYDGRDERVEFFNRARMRRDCGDDVIGNYITYNSTTEQFSVRAAKSETQPANPQSRVQAVIMPRNREATSPKTPCAPPNTKPVAAPPTSR